MANYTQRIDEGLLYEISKFIKNYQEDNGSSPSVREIANKFHTNPKRAHKYAHALANRGLLEFDDDGTIAMPDKLDKEFQFVPKLGAVKCGVPTLAIEDYDEAFRLPREFTGEGEFFMLEAEGDSMIDANIFEGDLLVIRRQEYADSGDIVVAIRGEFSDEADATLKRFKYKNGKPILHAENESGEYEDMDATEFRIIGKLKCFIRDME